MKRLILEISESEKKRILQMHENASRIERGLFYEQTEPAAAPLQEIPPKSAKPFSLNMSIEEEGKYGTESSDPKAFIDIMVNNILAKINENPEAKALLDQKKLTISYITVDTGSSNSWGGKETSFDKERAKSAPFALSSQRKVKTLSGDPQNKLYQLNKNLAIKRADTFLPLFVKKLQAKGVQISSNTQQNSFGHVVYTKGKVDGKHDYPFKGQFVLVTLTIANKIDVDTFRVNLTKYSDIQDNFVLKGHYDCAGWNGAGHNTSENTNTYLPYCNPVRAKYPLRVGDANYNTNFKQLRARMGSFEIKWNPDVLNEPWDRPVRRWYFNWVNVGGRVKIQDVSCVNIDKMPMKFNPPGAFAEGNKPPNDPELVYLMNLGTLKLWDKYIKPNM